MHRRRFDVRGMETSSTPAGTFTATAQRGRSSPPRVQALPITGRRRAIRIRSARRRSHPSTRRFVGSERSPTPFPRTKPRSSSPAAATIRSKGQHGLERRCGADTDTLTLAATSAALNSATDTQLRSVEIISAAAAAAAVTIKSREPDGRLPDHRSNAADTITGSSGQTPRRRRRSRTHSKVSAAMTPTWSTPRVTRLWKAANGGTDTFCSSVTVTWPQIREPDAHRHGQARRHRQCPEQRPHRQLQ